MNDETCTTSSDKGRILVVDDEPSVRLSFRLSLETVGWRVDDADESEQALAALESAREPGTGESCYDGMVLDFRMPGRNGVDMLEELKQRRLFVPTVLASAHLDDATVVKALRLGVVNFLQKPVSLASLRQGVECLVADERQFALASASITEKFRDGACAATELDSATISDLARLRGWMRRRRPEAARIVLAPPPREPREGTPQDSVQTAIWRMVLELLEESSGTLFETARNKPLFDLLADLTVG